MKRHLFFDLDGTLADTDGDIRLAWKAAMSRMKLECPTFDRDFVAGPPIEKMAQTLFGADFPLERCAELRRLFGECYDTGGLPTTVEYPGMPETLEELSRRGCTLAIVTNKRHAGALAVAAKFGWARRFAKIYAGDMHDANPAIGRMDKTKLLGFAMRELCAAPEDSIMVGDTAGDFAAARANGVESVAVAWGYGKPEELAQADAIVHEPDALLRLPSLRA